MTFELETFEWVKSDFVSETFETEKPEWVDSDLRTAAYRTPFSSRGVELSAFRSRPNFGAVDTPRLVVGCKLNFAAVTRRSPSDKSRLYADHSPCTGNSIQFFSFFFLSDVTVTTASVSQSLSVISRSRSALTHPPFLLIIFSTTSDRLRLEPGQGVIRIQFTFFTPCDAVMCESRDSPNLSYTCVTLCMDRGAS